MRAFITSSIAVLVLALAPGAQQGPAAHRAGLQSRAPFASAGAFRLAAGGNPHMCRAGCNSEKQACESSCVAQPGEQQACIATCTERFQACIVTCH